jgi:hypothetical protein
MSDQTYIYDRYRGHTKLAEGIKVVASNPIEAEEKALKMLRPDEKGQTLRIREATPTPAKPGELKPCPFCGGEAGGVEAVPVLWRGRAPSKQEEKEHYRRCS